jgi:hypothetical protein
MANEPAVENIAHLTLEHLKYIRASSDRMETAISDLKFRVGQIEETLQHQQHTLTHHTHRFDRVDDRLKIIEKRLGLVDA